MLKEEYGGLLCSYCWPAFVCDPQHSAAAGGGAATPAPAPPTAGPTMAGPTSGPPSPTTAAAPEGPAAGKSKGAASPGCDPVCDEGLGGDPTGAGYRGCQTRTRSGRTCQAWEAQAPQTHVYTPDKFPEADMEGNAYCRNLPGEMGQETIWCYTTDPAKRMDLCEPRSCAARDEQQGEEEEEEDENLGYDQVSEALLQVHGGRLPFWLPFLLSLHAVPFC